MCRAACTRATTIWGLGWHGGEEVVEDARDADRLEDHERAGPRCVAPGVDGGAERGVWTRWAPSARAWARRSAE